MARRSRYDQLVSPRANREELPIKVETLVRKARAAGIYFGHSPAEAYAVWPTPASKGIEQIIPLEKWLQCENCWRQIAMAFVIISGTASVRTRSALFSLLSRGWFTFLVETDKASICLAEITAKLFEDFIVWLNVERDGIAKWHVNSRRMLFGSARRVVQYLQETGEAGLSQFYIREAPWPAAHHETVHRSILSRPHVLKLVRSANSAVESFCRRRQAALCAMEVQKSRALELSQGDRYHKGEFESLGLVLALLDHRYPTILPPFDLIKRDDSRLAGAISRNHGGLREIESFFYPTMASLLPFFILQQYHWAANTETLLSLKLSEVSVDDVVGRDRVRCRPVKERANGSRTPRSYPVTEDVTNPAAMFRYIEEWSSRFRQMAHPIDRDKYWLVVSRVDPRRPRKPLLPIAITVTGQKSTLDAARRSFCKKNNVPDFRFNQLRKTKLDITDELFSGDVHAVAAEAGHGSVDTTGNSYRSPGAAARDDQMISMLQASRDRFHFTKGRIDSRDRQKNEDKYCATPGFSCADPLDAPWDFIARGQLCTAYCWCPICPHAAVNVTSEYSLARLLQLRDSLVTWAEELVISPERWKRVYFECVKALDQKWLPLFVDTEILENAARLDLSSLPDPE